MLKPLFIFSLPRSGSTLLQRVLAADSRIASVAEPWLLLPLVYALREQGIRSEYSHGLASQALNDFILELPNGRQDYLSAVGSAVRELYQKAAKSKDARYFLDKTPRYALVADEIIDMFPDGKFIFLWRSPLAVIASMVETWGKGRWNIPWFRIDLFDGLAGLIDAYQAHSERSLAINYENFLLSPGKELSRIAEYLELEFDPKLLKDFSQTSFRGEFGDPTGIKAYSEIDRSPLEKWKEVINNPLRKMWCRRYLRWHGEDRLKMMGYDLSELLRELESSRLTLSNLLSDSIRMLNLRTNCANLVKAITRSSFS